MSPEEIVKSVNYRSNAVFKKAGEDARSLSRKGHSIYQASFGDTVKVMRRNEAVKLVEAWIGDGFELANEIATDVLP